MTFNLHTGFRQLVDYYNVMIYNPSDTDCGIICNLYETDGITPLANPKILLSGNFITAK